MRDNYLETKKDFNIADLEQQFIDYVDVAEKTIENYKDGIENFVRFLQNNKIKQPNRNDVINWRNYLRANYSASTVNSYLTSVKAFFKFLENNKIYHNITNDVKGSKMSNITKKEVLSLNDVKIIYNQLTDKREKALFSLCITTGIRLHETVNINIEDIKKHNGENVVWILRKKHYAKDDYVKLSEEVMKDIKEYIGERKEGPLFISNSNHNKGGCVTTKTLRLEIKKIFKRFGIDTPKISGHTLRRSFACMAYDNGATIYDIQKVLGHSNIQTTTIYLQQVDRNNNKTELNMSKLILGGN